MRRAVSVGVLGLVVAGLSVFLEAQTAVARQTPATMDDLLTEIRGLRGDLARSSSASIQAQLLVARLQVEEQRLNDLAKQLLEVQPQLLAVQQNITNTASQLARAEDDLNKPPNNWLSRIHRGELADQVYDVKRRLANEQQREQQLVTRNGELTQQFAVEQARWNDFSSRLDSLERSLTTR